MGRCVFGIRGIVLRMGSLYAECGVLLISPLFFPCFLDFCSDAGGFVLFDAH